MIKKLLLFNVFIFISFSFIAHVVDIGPPVYVKLWAPGILLQKGLAGPIEDTELIVDIIAGGALIVKYYYKDGTQIMNNNDRVISGTTLLCIVPRPDK